MIFALPLGSLVKLWMHAISGGLLILAQWMSDQFVEEEFNLLTDLNVNDEVLLLPTLSNLKRYVSLDIS